MRRMIWWEAVRLGDLVSLSVASRCPCRTNAVAGQLLATQSGRLGSVALRPAIHLVVSRTPRR